ncbi:MAG: DNA-binding transcriptional regulator Fis [Coxiellaceae bacterium]|nr:DNA-binding transcriptional regulator Fis [Coxiellaceae bacterium]MDF1760159.1 DNA-binding transcriptional regulator Fis [Coxiellaceae bacterium]MDF1796627.1 DNA-binding transcriptional regulator Fis [Coxiellaceae bacterium]
MLEEVMTSDVVEAPVAATTSQSVQSMRDSVENLLDRYFSQLDGEDPANLYKMVLAEMEIPLLKKVLEYTRGNQCKAAIILGISRGTLRKKIKQYNID